MKLPETWSEIGFTVEITEDGSLSLRLSAGVHADRPGESMHHSGGAAAETELIYGQVIRRCFEKIPTPHFVSVGLGLGYVELVVMREALLRNFTLESFELVPELKALLLAWLANQQLPFEIQNVYDRVLAYVLKETDLDPALFKSRLLQKQKNGEWVLHGALQTDFSITHACHGLLFDAFSSKTSPGLWTEEFLVDFFQRAMAPDSLISTYACRASLKRALHQAGFEVEIREGFKGKRNSTLGRRGVFSQA